MTNGGWTVLVPVKSLDVAKSRFSSLSADERVELALAFVGDVVAASAACPAVDGVVVVTDDTRVRESVAPSGAVAVSPGTEGVVRGLNAELAAVAAGVGGAVAVVVGDLPCLRREDLASVLRAASGHDRAFVGDAAGTGTTVLTALSGARLGPRFGARSHAAHASSGATSLAAAAGVRRDVDDAVDLWDAVRIGVGPLTAATAAARRLRAGRP